MHQLLLLMFNDPDVAVQVGMKMLLTVFTDLSWALVLSVALVLTLRAHGLLLSWVGCLLLANASSEARSIREMAEYVEGIQVKQAGQVITGQVNPQVAAMFAHIKAELVLWIIRPCLDDLSDSKLFNIIDYICRIVICDRLSRRAGKSLENSTGRSYALTLDVTGTTPSALTSSILNSIFCLKGFDLSSEPVLREVMRAYDDEELLCPLHALQWYLHRTQSPFRPRHLFLSVRDPKRSISKTAISYFLWQLIHAAHEDFPHHLGLTLWIRAHCMLSGNIAVVH
ncbi:hypothetical protein E2C01_026469 [Portunus trituberculatus]|uniref:Uncharacterized protein n=1 Tax=Portunus trituberculatus TaxID=210409 RepID=A0A5B7EIU7_PORTR|nr:hypothetical protein [Portunus trituberculatus]